MKSPRKSLFFYHYYDTRAQSGIGFGFWIPGTGGVGVGVTRWVQVGGGSGFSPRGYSSNHAAPPEKVTGPCEWIHSCYTLSD